MILVTELKVEGKKREKTKAQISLQNNLIETYFDYKTVEKSFLHVPEYF